MDYIGSSPLTCQLLQSYTPLRILIIPFSARYEGQMHCSYGYLVIALAFALSAIDLFAGAGRVLSHVTSIERLGEFSFRSFWNRVILSQGADHVSGIHDPEYTSLVMEESEELEGIPKTRVYSDHRFVAATTDGANTHDETHRWVDKVWRNTEALPESPLSDHTFVGHRFSRDSQHSDDTLQDQDHVVKDIPLSRRIGQLAFGTLQRFLVFAGFAQLMHGIVIYTGGCRENYLNGCLAHIISELIIDFSNASPTHPIHRGWHFLVLRSYQFCSFPRIILRIGLGLEPRALGPASLRRICGVFCDFLLRDNQYVDGALWRGLRRPLYQQADSAHKYRYHVLVRRFTRVGS